MLDHYCENEVSCSKCGAPIQCGERCRDLAPGNGRPKRRWQCGLCRPSGIGRVLTYHCSIRCYWRDRRAKLHGHPKPRKCANPKCGKRFTPGRSDARTCSSACRQAEYRRRSARR
jgi:hypothetical protein